MYLMKLVSVSIYCLLIYDILLTSAKEVRHIYRSRASLVKLLWFLNRWLVPITLAVHFWNIFALDPSRKFCKVTGGAALWLYSINLLVIQSTLCLRVIAIYNRSALTTWFILFLLTASTGSRVILFALRPVKQIPLPRSLGLTGCMDEPSSDIAGAYWATLVLDTVLFVMTVLRMGSGIPDRKVLRHAPIIVLLFRDGAIYFLIVVAAISLTVAGYYHFQLLGPCTSSFLVLGILSTACSRLLLNLREAVNPPTPLTSMGDGSQSVEFVRDLEAVTPILDSTSSEGISSGSSRTQSTSTMGVEGGVNVTIHSAQYTI